MMHPTSCAIRIFSDKLELTEDHTSPPLTIMYLTKLKQHFRMAWNHKAILKMIPYIIYSMFTFDLWNKFQHVLSGYLDNVMISTHCFGFYLDQWFGDLYLPYMQHTEKVSTKHLSLSLTPIVTASCPTLDSLSFNFFGLLVFLFMVWTNVIVSVSLCFHSFPPYSVQECFWLQMTNTWPKWT